jgi:hypothetical protein
MLTAAALLLTLTEDAEARPRQPTWGVYCRREFGAAAGVLNAPNTWERLGRSPLFPTAGVILGGACGLDVQAINVTGALDLTLFYLHYDAMTKTLTQGGLSGDLAVTGGSDEWRGGVHTVLAPWPTGAGITGQWLPGNPRRGRDGLEARMTLFWPVQPNFQVMLLYVVTTSRIP